MAVTIGHAKAVINPQLPVPLSGYDAIRICTGIHDPLYARVLVFYDQEYHALIVLDTLAVDEQFTSLVRNALVDLGFAKEHIIFSATHTHSGPQGLCTCQGSVLEGLERTFGAYDPAYASFCVRQIAEAVKTAQQNQKSYQIKFVQTAVSGVAQERHGRSSAMDGLLWAMEFIVEDDLPLLLYSYPCHPTILNAQNKELSADLCYGVETSLAQRYQMTVFVNGAAGDISTRFARTEATFAEVLRMGKLVADTLAASLATAAVQDAGELHWQEYCYELQLKKLPSLEQAEKLVSYYEQKLLEQSSRLLESQLEGARANLHLTKHLGYQSNPVCKIIKANLGPLRLVTMPLELYGSLAAKVAEDTQILGYANGYYLYLPDHTAYEEQDYEALSSPFAQRQGEQLMDWIQTIL